MLSGDEGALFGIPGLIDFLEKYFLIPAQGYGIHLSTRVNLYGHALCPILYRKHQEGVE